jgi:hypothetical protein
MAVPRLTKEQAAIVGAYTGFAIGPFSDIQEYAEKVLGKPLWTHEFADKKLMLKLREAAKADFIAIAHEREG